LFGLAGSAAGGQDMGQATGTSTLQVTSRLVVLDVVVVGPDGKPVTNLDRSSSRYTRTGRRRR